MKNDRGTLTREKIVQVAFQLFAKKGFDGTSARDIAREASVPLGSITYHFETKEALYRATLEQLQRQMAEVFQPAVQRAMAALSGSAQDAENAIAIFQSDLIEVFIGRPEAETWSMLLLREHFDPSQFYNLVNSDAGGGAVDLLSALIGHSTSRPKDDPNVILEAFMKMGEVLVFRVLQEAVKRRLNWTMIGGTETQSIKTVMLNKGTASG